MSVKAEQGRFDLARPGKLPGTAGQPEILVAPQIECVAGDLKRLALHFVNLWVCQHPTRSIPVFSNPVVITKFTVRIQVSGVAHSHARWCTLMARQGYKQHRKVTAVTDNPLLRCALSREWRWIDGLHPSQDLLYRAQVLFLALDGADLNVIQLNFELMDQESLNNLGKLSRFVR
jgi:hypothetical protein